MRYHVLKPVHYENGELEVLEDVFDYGDLKGATGIGFEILSKDQYEERVTEERAIELLDSCGLYEERHGEGTDEEKEAFYKELLQYESIEEVVLDTSYSEFIEDFREKLGLSEEQAYALDCVRCGRMFHENYEGNLSSELSELIRKYES
jgi:hypothetical protein